MKTVEIISQFKGYRVEPGDFFVDEVAVNDNPVEVRGDLSLEVEEIEHGHRKVNLIV